MTDDELYEWAYHLSLENRRASPLDSHRYAVLAVKHRRPDKMRDEVDDARLDEFDELDIKCDHAGHFEYWCRECRPSDRDLQKEIVRLQQVEREFDNYI